MVIMKVVLLYRPNSESSRMVEEYAHDLEQQYQARIDLVSLDTRDGTSTASLYDVVQYPAILVLSNDGSVVQQWQGNMLPRMQEISYYTHS